MAEINQSVGTESSSYKVQQSASRWGNVGTILGALIAAGGMVVPMLPANSKWAIIVGGAVAVMSQVYKGLIELGYMKGRADIGVAETVANAPAQSAPGVNIGEINQK